MKELLRVKAFILRSELYGDHRKILSLFTKEKGRITASATGIGGKSALNFVIEPFNYAELELEEGRSGRLNLKSGEILQHFAEFSRDPYKNAAAAHISEIYEAFTEEQVVIPELGELLAYGYYGLSKSDDIFFDLAVLRLRFLAESGYAPAVSFCTFCDQDIFGLARPAYGSGRGFNQSLNQALKAPAGQNRSCRSKAYISLSEGGLVCQRCAAIQYTAGEIKEQIEKRSLFPVSKSAAALIQKISTCDYRDLFTFKASQSLKSRLIMISEAWLYWNGERRNYKALRHLKNMTAAYSILEEKRNKLILKENSDLKPPEQAAENKGEIKK